MMTAKEAREKQEQTIERYLKDTLNRIEKAIKDSISKGYTTVNEYIINKG